MIAPRDVSGLVLAGGLGTRMQQAGRPPAEKGLLLLHGKPLVSWAVDAMSPDLVEIYISANRHLDVYAGYGTVVADDPSLGRDLGPLAGIASAMQRISTPWLYVAPADVPRPPADLLERLLQHLTEHACELVYACTDRPQPLFMLVNKNLLCSLRQYLHDGLRQVQPWQREHGLAVQFDGSGDEFFNINTPDDLRLAHQQIAPRRI